MTEEMADKIGELVSELDTAAGMLIVSAMKDKTVREAMEKIADVSMELGEIINEG